MTKTQAKEYDVYSRLINFLRETGWNIVCASPPAGTDNRFRKCLLPRRALDGSEKGPRDEVDITAHDGQIILLVECKAKLSHSFTHLNRLLESDYQKLKRIEASFNPIEIAELLQRGTGVLTPRSPSIASALAVEVVDYPLPEDMTVFEVTADDVIVHPSKLLFDRFNI
jgi:hypothetical protein